MKKILVVLVIAVVAFGVWRWTRSTPVVEATDARLLLDRVWIDHIPSNERDQVNVFALISEESIGVFQTTSRWKGAYEGFRFEARGEEVRALFPQNGDKQNITAKARKCKEKGMDFCLDVSGTNRGTKRYYSREGWEINSSHDEEHFVTHLLQSAPAE
jgi:hypothetical protein